MPFDVITYAKTPHLDSNKKIPLRYLPDYPGEIQEYDSFDKFPNPGQENITYVALDTRNTYRWSNKIYSYYLLSSHEGKVVDLSIPIHNTSVTPNKWEYKTIVESVDGKVTFPFANSTKKVGTNTYLNVPGIVAVENEDVNNEGQIIAECKNQHGLFMTDNFSDLDQKTNIAIYPASRFQLRNHRTYLPLTDDVDHSGESGAKSYDSEGKEKYTNGAAKRPITIGNLEDAIKYGLGDNSRIDLATTKSIHDALQRDTDWTLIQQKVATSVIGASNIKDSTFDGLSLYIGYKYTADGSTKDERRPENKMQSRADWGIASRRNQDDSKEIYKKTGGVGIVELQIKEATQRQLRVKGDENVADTFPKTYDAGGTYLNTGTNNAVTAKNVDEAVKSALAYFNAQSVYKEDGTTIYPFPTQKQTAAYSGDTLTATYGTYTSDREVYIDESKWKDGKGEQTRANITIGSLKDAVVWDNTEDIGYPTGGVPVRVESVDKWRRLKLALAKSAVDVTPTTGSPYVEYRDSFGLLTATKNKGLRFTRQNEADDTSKIFQGRLQVDETRKVAKTTAFNDDPPVDPEIAKWKYNDILKRTGLSYDGHEQEDDLSTKVLTTKYINDIFKYGMGHFPYKNEKFKEFWLSNGWTEGTTPVYDPLKDEQLTARETIFAQKKVEIRYVE